jgi:ubiquinone/menaquinone biosynthesis C-methylase UbiE
MLQSARSAAGDGPLLVGDVQALPFADDAFDVTLAMHMLYHVPDRPRAIAELRRVLRPGGVALAVTNSDRHFEQLDDLLVECAADAAGVELPAIRSFIHFTMENGADELGAVFDSVTAHDFVSELVITEVEPVLNYAGSLGMLVADTSHELDAVLPELERRVREIIATEGAFRVRSASGCFVCR